MGDIVITEFITMDGIIGTPQWTVPYQHDEIEAYKKDELFASDGHCWAGSPMRCSRPRGRT